MILYWQMYFVFSAVKLTNKITSMDFDEAHEIAQDPNNIPGIYNYCDAWCERCLFTSRCLTFKMNKRFEEEYKQEEREKENVEFWDQVNEAIEDVQDLMEENEKTGTASLMDFGFDADDDDDLMEEHEMHRKKAREQPISKAAKRYMDTVHKWYKTKQDEGIIIFPEKREDPIVFNKLEIDNQAPLRRLSIATEIALYYHLQIWVKVNRALTSSYDDHESDPEFKDYPKDSDGSAKVALLAIDQSIAGWTTLHKHIPLMKPEVG